MSNRTDDWFHIAEMEAGVVLIEEPWHDELVKSYLILGTERAILLDTGTGVGDLRPVVRRLTGLPLTIVQSHAHWDHVGGTHQFAGEADILIHRLAADELRAGVSQERLRRYLAAKHLSGPFADMELAATTVIPGVEPTGYVEHRQSLDLGGRRLEVLHTPGHTKGLIALWDPDSAILFSTDAAYPAALYAQMPDSNLTDYEATLDMLATLEPAPRRVYPAHGASPMEPGLLPAMRDAIVAIRDGKAPDAVENGVATFDFGGFGYYTAWPLPTEPTE